MQIGFVLFQSRERIGVAKGPGPKPLLGELQQCEWSRSQADPRRGATELPGQGFAVSHPAWACRKGCWGQEAAVCSLSCPPGVLGPWEVRWGFHPDGHEHLLCWKWVWKVPSAPLWCCWAPQPLEMLLFSWDAILVTCEIFRGSITLTSLFRTTFALFRKERDIPRLETINEKQNWAHLAYRSCKRKTKKKEKFYVGC